ncbi:hypothetical protein CFP56_041802 [Quercus suber]|uniref:Uncharacterized protein n=1 Tax=Quercus suber TaxID=58331 RepID=A0AAW0IV95_QUESU
MELSTSLLPSILHLKDLLMCLNFINIDSIIPLNPQMSPFVTNQTTKQWAAEILSQTKEAANSEWPLSSM